MLGSRKNKRKNDASREKDFARVDIILFHTTACITCIVAAHNAAVTNKSLIIG